MNGGQALVRSLSESGVEVCFANPGTSEMHTVFALDSVDCLRAVLCLAEGVASGAADGYARMAGKPAATLLHLGPGLANGWANLHNARRAGSPVVNVVGDHATYHKRYDAPLESDIDSLARAVSRWVRRSYRSSDVGDDTAAAVAAALAPPGGIATLILPSDVSWSEGAAPGRPLPAVPPPEVPATTLDLASTALLKGKETVLLLGGKALGDPGLRAASRIAEATSARVLVETNVARMARGLGRPAFDSLGYFAEQATRQLLGTHQMVTAGALAPVGFFAYPGRPSSFVPSGCELIPLGTPEEDVVAALEQLAGHLAPGVAPRVLSGDGASRTDGNAAIVVADPSRPLDTAAVGALVGTALPAGAIVVDESVSARAEVAAGTRAAAAHDWLALTGGSIGEGLPLATGAAIACPDRPVVCIEADGSAMYTIQALWTQARERLNVTTVVLSNRAYAILAVEMKRIVTRAPGEHAAAMLDLSGPDLNFAALAEGMGVEACRARTVGDLRAALKHGIEQEGPFLVEADLTASPGQ